MYTDGRHVDVLFFVEHRDRELEVIAAIAHLLKVRFGLSVAVASTIFHPMLSAIALRPKVVVSTGIAPSKSLNGKREFIHAIFSAVYGASVTYACMNWEQILSPVNKSFRSPRDPFTRLTVHHFSWGVAYRRFLIERGVMERNIHVTGKPSYTLLRRKLASAGHLKAQLARRSGLPADARWLFFPMTCHLAFFSDFHVRSRIGAGSDEHTVLQHAAYVRRTVNQIFCWLADLGEAARQAGAMVVLRPHPAVSVCEYEERFRELVGDVPAHILITKESSAHDWVVASDACYTNYSSLALDANAIGKPSYLLEPEPYPSFLVTDWFEGLPRIHRVAELTETMLQRPTRSPAQVTGLSRHCDMSVDGVEATASELARLAARAPNPRWSPAGFARAVWVADRRRALGSVIRLCAASLNLWGMVRPGVRPDFFSVADVERLMIDQQTAPPVERQLSAP